MEEYARIIDGITDRCKALFQNNLTGIYVHGSIAMHCFTWNKSDIDLLIVVKEDPDVKKKRIFMDYIIEINKIAPPKGIELSMVLESVCREFVYPTPFVLHFSNAHIDWYMRDPEGYCLNMRGMDKDLAAHFTITKKYGITWWGMPINELYGEVPRDSYLDSINTDLMDCTEDIEKNPMYTILTLCRVAAYRKDDLILSKEEGGIWGCQNLQEEYSNLIMNALQCYRDEQKPVFDPGEVNRFKVYLTTLMEKGTI